MATMPPPTDCAHPAAPAKQVPRQWPPRPRRRGRLLVGSLTVILIAALVPRALADIGSDGMAFDDMFQLDPPTGQAPLIAAADTGGDGGDGGNQVTASVQEAFDQDGGIPETRHSGADGDDPEQTEAPLVAAQVRLEGHDPDAAQDDSTTPDDQLAAVQGQLAEPAGCTGGGCPEGVAIPKDVISAASTRGGSSRGDDASRGGDQPSTPLDQRIARLKVRVDWLAELQQSSDPLPRGQASRELKAILRETLRLRHEQIRGSSRSNLLEEVRQKVQEELDKLKNPMVAVDLDDTQLPGYGQVTSDQLSKLPGFTAGARDSGVLQARATSEQRAASAIPADSDLRKLTLTQKAAVVLGVEPSTVANAGIATSVVLVGGAFVWAALSARFSQLRLAWAQDTRNGGRNAVPLMTPSRPVDG
jgi:hypothetical protein